MGEGTIRRVVTGLDDQGRSTVIIDDRQPVGGAQLLWMTDTHPADNSGQADAAARGFGMDLFTSPGSTFMLFEMQPGGDEEGPLMHATNTTDYIVVLKGQVELILDTGSVILGPGDVAVDRGVIHGWQAAGGEPAVAVAVLVSANPVGAGATI